MLQGSGAMPTLVVEEGLVPFPSGEPPTWFPGPWVWIYSGLEWYHRAQCLVLSPSPSRLGIPGTHVSSPSWGPHRLGFLGFAQPLVSAHVPAVGGRHPAIQHPCAGEDLQPAAGAPPHTARALWGVPRPGELLPAQVTPFPHHTQTPLWYPCPVQGPSQGQDPHKWHLGPGSRLGTLGSLAYPVLEAS